MMSKSFETKVALVTGASSGIGRATAIAFAREGAKVIVTDISAKGEDTVAEIAKAGGEATFIQCDVSDQAQIRELHERAVERYGGFDYAFNNAGIEGDQNFVVDQDPANFDRVIAVNLKGPWLCMREQIPRMLERGGGVIVNCSSIAGLVGLPGITPYAASKHGLIGITKSAALEYATQNIRVNAICPGVIQTPMIDRFTQADTGKLESLTAGAPIGRVGRPEEIAGSVLYLCSDAATYVTGHALVVDGGWTAR